MHPITSLERSVIRNIAEAQSSRPKHHTAARVVSREIAGNGVKPTQINAVVLNLSRKNLAVRTSNNEIQLTEEGFKLYCEEFPEPQSLESVRAASNKELAARYMTREELILTNAIIDVRHKAYRLLDLLNKAFKQYDIQLD